MAAVVGAVVAGVGGWFVPRLVARIPEVEPETEGDTRAARASTEADPDLAAGAVSEPHARSEQDAAVTAPSNDDPPEPFARVIGTEEPESPADRVVVPLGKGPDQVRGGRGVDPGHEPTLTMPEHDS